MKNTKTKNNDALKTSGNSNTTQTEQNTKQNAQQKKEINVKNSHWFPILIFVFGSAVFGTISYFLGGEIGRPNGTLPQYTLFNNGFAIGWCTTLFLLSLATYFQFISKKTRPIIEIKENLMTFYIHLLLVFFWPLIFFRVESPIIACILIGLAVITSIYLVYRYFNSSVTAGVLSTFWCIWLMYIFYINLAYILLTNIHLYYYLT